METMKDFEEEINRSFRKFSQGVILPEEYSDDPSFHAMDEIRAGDEITAMVLDADDGQGRVLLSLKQARQSEAWKVLKEAYENRTVYEVKVKVIDIVDGKIKLSMKDAEDVAPEVSEAAESVEYETGEQATTSLGSLLAGIKLD